MGMGRNPAVFPRYSERSNFPSCESLTAPKKSVFIIDKREEMDIEELELELIDYGLEEIEEDLEPQENGDDKTIFRIFADFFSWTGNRKSNFISRI